MHQEIDSQTYPKTIHALQQRYPETIIVPQNSLALKPKLNGSVTSSGMLNEGRGDAILMSCLGEAFEDVDQVRSH